MATSYGDTVNAFYLAYYGRPADPAGLAFWTAALQKNNGDFSTIVSAFANSPEASVRFASVSVADRVSEIYQQLFNRPPEKAGLDFWVEAIESGRLSIANAAIEIMHAAQSSDAQISTARQQVAAQFTAEVEKSGIPYDGVAAVQAARVLISAVTADSKPADIDALVKAGSSLVQTAHDNPAVITALANGGDLSKVLSSASGQADPVGMVQALASVGKAALTDSAGLSTLLQGGGVSGLLNSLPAGTSLKDVAAAVTQGGLSAGVEAAKPAPAVPADTTPPAAPTVQLAEDTGLSATDHVTSKGKIQVSGIESGATWQYSADAGKTWRTGPAADDKGTAVLETTANGQQTLQVRAVDAAGNIGAATSFEYTLRTSIAPTMVYVVDGKEVPGLDTLTVNSIDYLVHVYGTTTGTGFYFEVSDSGKDGSWTTVKDTDPLSEGTHYIRYVATDLAGNIGATNALKLVMDLTAPAAPKVALVQDTGVSNTDHVTSDGHIQVSGIEAQGSWEYSFDGQTWVTGPAANADGVAVLATTTNGAQTLQVRSHDLARNTSEVVKLDYTLQTSFTPTLAFRDGADGADLPGTTLLTNTDDYWVTLHGGLNAAKVVFQLSDSGLDGTWADADPSAPLSDGTHYIRDIVTDRAGNTGTTNALRVDMDKTAPAVPKVELVNDTGVSATDHFTSDGNIKISGIEAKGSWQYSFDAGQTWTAGPAANADGVAILATSANGAQSLQVRAIDAAHNTSAVTTFDYTLQTSFNPWLAFRDGANGADLPGDTLLTNTDDYWVTLHGGLGAAKVVFQISDNKDSGWHDADPAAALADGTYYIRDIITDKAGNTGTTNWLRVDMDKTAPGTPKVELLSDTGVSATDRLTSDGRVKVSGIETGGSWEYSFDAGQTWTTGPAADADGAAILATGAAGPQSLQVRSHDAAHNTSAVATLDFTLQTSFNPWLAFRDGANGADLPGTTLLTNTDDFWITLHGGLDAAKVVYQVSDTGLEGSWADADMAAPMPDGTHYIRDIVTDRAGNVGITNALRVDMDKTAPDAPAVALLNDTGDSATDGITSSPEYRVSGIEAGASWEYSTDGSTWLKGVPADAQGVATGVLSSTGDQTLLFRTTDKAGNVSGTATLHANYVDRGPLDELAFDHITGGAKGVTETTLTKVDVVYTYTGTLDAGEAIVYSMNNSAYTKADASMIDTGARTITFHDVDLSTGDIYLDVRATNVAGWTMMNGWQFIDGPVTRFTTEQTDSGFVIYSDQGAHAWLTDGANPPAVLTAADGGTVITSDIGTAVGVQASGVSGVLGVGRSATVHSDSGVAYGLGSTGNDTLSGKFVWGYAGDDDITTAGDGGTVIGGAGADTIHVNAGSATMVIHAGQSSVAADGATAHGFDTVYSSPSGQGITLGFTFDAAIKDSYQAATASSFTGAETGAELLALLTGAVAGSFQAKGNGNGQAMVVQTGGAANFLVVDVNGDANIDASDYVVKIVGAIDPAHMAIGFGTGSVYLPVLA